MAHLKLGNQEINQFKEDVYIIAEIGQNHQGDLYLAKKMIKQAKICGCDCVKFQKSQLNAKFTQAVLQRPYDGENSWGRTYGEHKRYLEFSPEQYKELQRSAKKHNIDFTASAMDEESLEFVAQLEPPFIKIGSGDANNLMLLEKCAQLKCPLIISTGMQHLKTIDAIVEIMERFHKYNYALMHCVSAYPTAPEHCQLRMINFLQQRYPHVIVGYSGHEEGGHISLAAILLGARILERHFTLDKTAKGSDHKCSLEPAEMEQLVKHIRDIKFTVKPTGIDHIFDNLRTILKPTDSEMDILKKALQPVRTKEILACELPCKMKLGKSLVASRFLVRGQSLALADICIKVCYPHGIPAEDLHRVLGQELRWRVEKDMPIFEIDLED